MPDLCISGVFPIASQSEWCLHIFLTADTAPLPVTIISWNRAGKNKPQRGVAVLSLIFLPWVDLFSPESMEIAAVFLRIVVLESRRLLAPINFVGYYPAGLALRVQNLTNTIS